MRFLFIPLLLLLGIASDLNGQEREITLKNPSFEGLPHTGKQSYTNQISFWKDCGRELFVGESPPDLQPGFFQVSTKPQNGNSYIGLVVRDNDTWESVSQSLSAPLKGGNCYSFTLYLSKSRNYLSPARNTGVMVEVAASRGEEIESINHNTPCVLRIWGSKSSCKANKAELLAESRLVDHENWVQYDFKFEPLKDYYFLTLEAFVKTPTLLPYNGHILIDDLSSIKPIPCKDPAPEIAFENPKKNIKVTEDLFDIEAFVEFVDSKENIEFLVNDKSINEFNFAKVSNKFYSKIRLKKGKNNIRLKGTNVVGNAQEDVVIIYEPKEIVAAVEEPKVEAPPVAKPSKPLSKTISGLEKKELKEEQILEIKNLSFEENSFVVGPTYFPILDEIYGFLKSNSDVVVEIGGHTNNNCDAAFCKELSENRAKAVADYLKQNGIPDTQLRYKGYGSAKPISTNKTALGRKKNQRVEVKIISMGS